MFTFPIYIKFEATRGCNRHCEFCGIMRHDDDPQFLNPDVFYKVLKEISTEYVKRVDFGMDGEVLLNDKVLEYVPMVRQKMQDVQMSIVSNVDVLVYKDKSFKRLINLFESGLNNYQADLYDEVTKEKFYELCRENREKFKKLDVKIINYYNSHVTPWTFRGNKHRTIIICDESKGFNLQKVKTRQFYASSGMLPDKIIMKYGVDLSSLPLLSKCKEPMKYCAIGNDGRTFICCSDQGRTISSGNVLNNTIKEIWRGERIQKIRYALSAGRRDLITSCYFCNRYSFRVGLYPYWGKNKYNKDELMEEFSKDVFIHENIKKLFIKYGDRNCDAAINFLGE